PGMLYCRSYGGRQMLASEGIAGEVLATPQIEQGDIPMDAVIEVAEQVASRFPGWEEAGLAASWTGVYDVTPDWNPVLGPVPGLAPGAPPRGGGGGRGSGGGARRGSRQKRICRRRLTG
ncbi:MAG: hypothetical protein ACK4MZ_08985, partial [Thermomonas haemolytica]